MADRGSAAAGETSNRKRQQTARSRTPAMAMSDKRARAERLCLGLFASRIPGFPAFALRSSSELDSLNRETR